MSSTNRQTFRGQIAGAGSTSGVRIVVGRWVSSPFGTFADAMVETATGQRILVAPSAQVRDFVARTYTFDETRIEPVTAVVEQGRWQVRAPSLALDLTVGSRMPLGWLLRCVPPAVATRPAWATAVDPFARVVMRGIRTRGSARDGGREWYGATDLHRVVAASGTFDGVPLGALADVEPPCRFGFSSTPRTPSVTDVTTTVSLPHPR